MYSESLIDTVDFSTDSIQIGAYKDTDHPSRKATESKWLISDALTK